MWWDGFEYQSLRASVVAPLAPMRRIILTER